MTTLLDTVNQNNIPQLTTLSLSLSLLNDPTLDGNQRDIITTYFYTKTPLCIAAEEGFPDILALLLAHPEIDVNRTDTCGKTPLVLAPYQGHLDVVTLLLPHPDIGGNRAD